MRHRLAEICVQTLAQVSPAFGMIFADVRGSHDSDVEAFGLSDQNCMRLSSPASCRFSSKLRIGSVLETRQEPPFRQSQIGFAARLEPFSLEPVSMNSNAKL